MKYILPIILFISFSVFSQETEYKKRVLETAEIEFLTSYYVQEGDNAAVTGGIGDEHLTDFTPTIVVSIPLNDDDVLTIDGGISAYTSASSSNLDPFDRTERVASGTTTTGASGSSGNASFVNVVSPTPWDASTGASYKDTWYGLNASYSHSSDDRNKIWSVNASVAGEWDYRSVGFGGSYSFLFNEKNTEISISGNAFFDNWVPYYPTELDTYYEAGGNLNASFFASVDIYDESGNAIDKNGTDVWAPLNSPYLIDEKRNTYTASLSFSQILSKNAQFSLFADVVRQEGWLANPMQRVYFADVDNYYIGEPASIQVYETKENNNVFQLADDIERLPDSRFKIPVGGRFNYYVNEFLTLRSYYRFYYDDWGIISHTAELETALKLSNKFTLYPSYRYYKQTAADYFGAYETLLSTAEFYTSDYDLSEFNANQFSLGVSYTDVFAGFKLFSAGLKTIDLRYSYYERNTGLSASIVSFGVKFVLD